MTTKQSSKDVDAVSPVLRNISPSPSSSAVDEFPFLAPGLVLSWIFLFELPLMVGLEPDGVEPDGVVPAVGVEPGLLPGLLLLPEEHKLSPSVPQQPLWVINSFTTALYCGLNEVHVVVRQSTSGVNIAIKAAWPAQVLDPQMAGLHVLVPVHWSDWVILSTSLPSCASHRPPVHWSWVVTTTPLPLLLELFFFPLKI